MSKEVFAQEQDPLVLGAHSSPMLLSLLFQHSTPFPAHDHAHLHTVRLSSQVLSPFPLRLPDSPGHQHHPCPVHVTSFHFLNGTITN